MVPNYFVINTMKNNFNMLIIKNDVFFQSFVSNDYFNKLKQIVYKYCFNVLLF